MMHTNNPYGGVNVNPYGGGRMDDEDAELEMLRAQQEEELIQQAMDESLRCERTNRSRNNNNRSPPPLVMDPMGPAAVPDAYDAGPTRRSREDGGRRRDDNMNDMPPPMEPMMDNNGPPPPMEPMMDSVHTKNWLYPHGTKKGNNTTTTTLKETGQPPLVAMPYDDGGIPMKKPPPPAEDEFAARRRRSSGSSRRNQHRRCVSYDDADEYYGNNNDDDYNNNPYHPYGGGGGGGPPTTSSHPSNPGHLLRSMLDDSIPQHDPLYDDSTRRDHYDGGRRGRRSTIDERFRNSDGVLYSSPRSSPRTSPTRQPEGGGRQMMAQSNYEFSTRRRERNFEDIPDTGATVSNPNSNSLLGTTTHSKQSVSTHNSWGGIDAIKIGDHDRNKPPSGTTIGRKDSSGTKNSWGGIDATRVAENRGRDPGRRSPTRNNHNDRMAYSCYDNYQQPNYNNDGYGHERRRGDPGDDYFHGNNNNDRGHGREDPYDRRHREDDEEDRRMAYSSYDAKISGARYEFDKNINNDGYYDDRGGDRRGGGRNEVPDRMAYSTYDNYGGGGYREHRGRGGRGGLYNDGGRRGRDRNEDVDRMAFSSYDNFGGYQDEAGRRRVSRSLSPKRCTSHGDRLYPDDSHSNNYYGDRDDLMAQPPQEQEWDALPNNNNRIPSSIPNYYGEQQEQQYDSRRNRSRSPRREPKEEAPLYPKLDDIMVMTGEDNMPKLETPTAGDPAVVTPSSPNHSSPTGGAERTNNSNRNSDRSTTSISNKEGAGMPAMIPHHQVGGVPHHKATALDRSSNGSSAADSAAAALGKFKKDLDPAKDFKAAQAKLAKPGRVQRHHTTGHGGDGHPMRRSHTTDCAPSVNSPPRRGTTATAQGDAAAATGMNDRSGRSRPTSRPDVGSAGAGGGGGSSSFRRSVSPASRGAGGTTSSGRMDRRDMEAKDWDTKMAAKLHDYRIQQSGARSGRSLSPAGRSPVPGLARSQTGEGTAGHLQQQSPSSLLSSPTRQRSSRSPMRKTRSTLGEGQHASPSPKRSPIRKTKSTLDEFSMPPSHMMMSPGEGPPPGSARSLQSPLEEPNTTTKAPQSPKQKGGMFKKLFSGSKEKK